MVRRQTVEWVKFEWMKNYSKTQKFLLGDSIINAFNTTKQMIVIKASQNNSRATHTQILGRVNRVSLILIVPTVSVEEKKQAQSIFHLDI